MEEFIIFADNNYLKKNTKAYYTLDYYGREYTDGTQFIRDLKNTFNEKWTNVLNNAKAKAVSILKQSLSEIIDKENLSFCTVVAVPRAKAYDTYLPQQLYLIDAISIAANSFDNVIDGTTYIRRHTNTKTTHLPRDTGRKTVRGNIYKGENANDGEEPYPGITLDTCTIDEDKIKGKTIILIDDIYTNGCNVDEDCIQALYEAGADEVIFCSLAKTGRREIDELF